MVCSLIHISNNCSQESRFLCPGVAFCRCWWISCKIASRYLFSFALVLFSVGVGGFLLNRSFILLLSVEDVFRLCLTYHAMHGQCFVNFSSVSNFALTYAFLFPHIIQSLISKLCNLYELINSFNFVT